MPLRLGCRTRKIIIGYVKNHRRATHRRRLGSALHNSVAKKIGKTAVACSGRHEHVCSRERYVWSRRILGEEVNRYKDNRSSKSIASPKPVRSQVSAQLSERYQPFQSVQLYLHRGPDSQVCRTRPVLHRAMNGRLFFPARIQSTAA